MANPEHLEILNKGVENWNVWREENSSIRPDLSEANLKRTDLRRINLSGADLSEAKLSYINFKRANLKRANLSGANLIEAKLLYTNLLEANLTRANLTRANLTEADLTEANLTRADLKESNSTKANLTGVNLLYADLSRINLSGADLKRAYLILTNLTEANLLYSDLTLTIFLRTKLSGANFDRCRIGASSFGDIDMSEIKGLENVYHHGPSSISLDTLYLSNGRIPEVFLRGCGVPDEFITYIPSFIGAQQSIQFYSCFISYSTQDEEFAKRLHSRMRDTKLRVWFAPEDMKGGKKIFDQIESAIQPHDRLLLVLSEHSMQSEWVFTEIRRALKTEKKEGRRKLFPIRLVDFEVIKEWELIDADTGKDLAVEIRSYFIPDFSHWKDHDNFENAFDRLLKDLKAEEK